MKLPTNTSNDPIFIGPEEAARRLRLTRSVVYRLLGEGQLPAFKMGRRWLISVEAVDAWARQRLREAGFEVPDAPRD